LVWPARHMNFSSRLKTKDRFPLSRGESWREPARAAVGALSDSFWPTRRYSHRAVLCCARAGALCHAPLMTSPPMSYDARQSATPNTFPSVKLFFSGERKGANYGGFRCLRFREKKGEIFSHSVVSKLDLFFF